MNAERAALEAGLVADPDNRAAHAAYADWLIERDDPVGEYLLDQQAREDDHHPLRFLSPSLFAAAPRIAQALDQLLGDLKPFLGLDRSPGTVNVELRQGLAHAIRFNIPTVAAIVAATEAKGLLLVAEIEFFGCDDRACYARLNPSRFENLRRLTVLDPIFNDDDLALLMSRGLPTRIETLTLENCLLTDDSAAALAALKRSRPKLSFALRKNVFSPLGRAILAEVDIEVGDQRFDELSARYGTPEEWI